MSNPENMANLEKMVSLWLKNKEKKSPVAKRANTALQLFKSGKAGNLLTPRNLLILGAALLYTISPIDAIPDVIPVIGWLDDMGILAMALGSISAALAGKKALPNEVESDMQQELECIEEEKKIQFPDISTDFSSWIQNDDELQQLINEAEASGNEDLIQEAEDLKHLASDPLQRIIFTGTFNSGKSSLINRLLEQELLPTRAIPTTPALTSILFGEQSNVLVHYKDDSYYGTTDASELKTKVCLDSNVKEIVVQLPHNLLQNGVTIVDTAGLQDTQHSALDYHELPQSLCLVFVKDMTMATLDRDECHFLKQVCCSLNASQIIIVLNKADKLSESDREASRRKITQQLEADLGLFGARIYTTCAASNAPDSFQISELFDDITNRASFELSALCCANVKQATQKLRTLCAAEQKRQEALTMLNESERKQTQLRAIEHKERLERTLTRRASILKDAFRNDLKAFLDEKLLGKVFDIIESSPVNNELPGKLGDACRASLMQYLDNACRNIVESFQTGIDETAIKEILVGAGRFGMPHFDEKLKAVHDASQYLIPAVMILTFPHMGLFGWLSNVVVPGYVMNKLNVTEIIKNLGPRCFFGTCAQMNGGSS